MPLVIHQHIAPSAVLGIWHISESNEELRSLLGENYFELEMETKLNQAIARHFLASRIILTQLFPNNKIHLTKNKFNKPSLEIDGKPYAISITHSHDYAGILIAKKGNVGLDLERVDTRISRVKNKFLNPTEQIFAGADEQIWEQTLIWSAKETLYKLYGNKELDFKEHLYIHSFIKSPIGIIDGSIKKRDFNLHVPIHFQQIDNYILTYTFQNEIP
jgi:phosphopantetheinyl transferase